MSSMAAALGARSMRGPKPAQTTASDGMRCAGRAAIVSGAAAVGGASLAAPAPGRGGLHARGVAPRPAGAFLPVYGREP